MTSPLDSRPYRFDRAVLRVYPRRFRLRFWKESALAIRDYCRTAHQERGPLGPIPLWGDTLFDLGRNAPDERVTRLVERSDAVGNITYSCSCCISDVEPNWRARKICGELLVEGAPHSTHATGPLPSFTRDVESVIDHARKGPAGYRS